MNIGSCGRSQQNPSSPSVVGNPQLSQKKTQSVILAATVRSSADTDVSVSRQRTTGGTVVRTRVRGAVRGAGTPRDDSRLVLDSCLIHQHDWDVVLYQIHPMALDALQALRALSVIKRLLARRANQNFQQVLGNHDSIVLKIGGQGGNQRLRSGQAATGRKKGARISLCLCASVVSLP